MRNLERLSKKEKRKLLEDKLLEKVYDLILNKETCEEERNILVEFKNRVLKGADFQLETRNLAEALRKLALSRFNHNEKLSEEVSKFYMDISTAGLFEKNLAIGLCSIKAWF